jgi:hypothetical protein
MSVRKPEPPVVNAVRLLRLSDRSLGGSQQTNYLIRGLEFNNKLMTLILESLEPGATPNFNLPEILSGLKEVFDTIEEAVAFYTEQTRKFFDPLRRLGENIEEDAKGLSAFESEWEKALQDLRGFELRLNTQAKHPRQGQLSSPMLFLKELRPIQERMTVALTKLDLIDDSITSKASNTLRRIGSTDATIRVDELFRLFTADP